MATAEYNNLISMLSSRGARFKNIRLEDFILPRQGQLKAPAELIAERDFNMTMHQLRRFFDKIKEIKMKLKRGESVDFKKELAILYPIARYSERRGFCKKEFPEFIGKALQTIQDKDDFLAFEKFMMAVVAFSKK